MTYRGPGDIVSGATAWYGFFAYDASYAAAGTNPCCDLRRSTDNATMTMAILATGEADVATVTTWLSGGATAYVTKMYDQTGNGHHVVQSTAASQPALSLAGINALPCLDPTGSKALVAGSTFTPSTGAMSLSLVSQRTGGFTTDGTPGTATGVQINFLHQATANKLSVTSSAALPAAAADGVAHCVQGVVDSTSSAIYVDGTATSGSTGALDKTAGAPSLCGITASSDTYIGLVGEFGFWDAVTFTATQAANLTANQQTRWLSAALVATGFAALRSGGAPGLALALASCATAAGKAADGTSLAVGLAARASALAQGRGGPAFGLALSALSRTAASGRSALSLTVALGALATAIFRARSLLRQRPSLASWPPYIASALGGAYLARASRRPYIAALPALDYISPAIGNHMPAVRDLPPIDATVQLQTVTFDFGATLPNGVTLTGTPALSCSVHTGSSGTDPDPSSRLVGSPAIGTSAPPQGTGVVDGAVLQQIGTMIGGVTYLLACSCATTSGDVVSMWTHVLCTSPS